MKADIGKLYAISQKTEKIAIGTMSGTSLDGLDIALCRLSGSGSSTEIKLLEFESYTYDDKFKKEIEAVFSRENIDTLALTLLHKKIGAQFAFLILKALQSLNRDASSIDFIASHGQTIFHAPLSMHNNESAGNATLQIGDGDIIATNTGIITISDFRQKHVAAGGEGAPLAPYADAILMKGLTRDFIYLNIGGIANYSYFKNGKLQSFGDSGPGNKLMNFCAEKNGLAEGFDLDAKLGLAGEVNPRLLNILLKHPYLQLSQPKSTGPETFSEAFLSEAVHELGETIEPADLMATLNRFTAETIAAELGKLNAGNDLSLMVTGGGAHNPLLMRNLRELIPAKFVSQEDMPVPADAKEAALMVLLANELLSGDSEDSLYKDNELKVVSMGKISLPH